MPAEHVVARCHWQSTFDQQAQAFALQDFISQWSNTVLLDELQECFDERCPPGQTWRIDSLQVDLGDIALEDLAQELPRRLRAALHEALDDLLNRQAPPADGQPALLIQDQDSALRDFIVWYLQQGHVPWWFQGSRSALQIFDELLAAQPDTAAEVLRDLGRLETVRQRIAWQLGEGRVRRIVHLLEPGAGELVCGYADQLFAVQSRQRVPPVAESDFRHHTWLNILTWLLVDRATLFNTTSFMRTTLWRTAQHYRIDPVALLEQIFQAVQALRPLGGIKPVFFTVIATLHQQASAGPAHLPAGPRPVDHWGHWQSMLRHGQARRTLDRRSLSYAELFRLLAREDTKRMTATLYAAGASAAVRQGLLRHLTASELALLAGLLAPLDQRFIIAHVEHTQQLMHLRHWDTKAIWSVLLTYLLLSRGSSFNRRQLVRSTLHDLCKTLGYSLSILLDLLIHSVVVTNLDQQRFELLVILRQLQGDLLLQPTPEPWAGRQWHGLLNYLESGRRNDYGRSTWQRLFAQLLSDSATPASRQRFGQLLASARLARISDSVLSQRLLGLVGAADWPRLLQLIEPDAVGHCLDLSRQLCAGQRRGDLPCLAQLDLALQLPALLIQALPGFYRRRRGSGAAFELAQLWRRLNTLLERQARVDTVALNRQLQACRLAEPLWGNHPYASAGDDVELPDWNWPRSELTADSASGSPSVVQAQLLSDLARDETLCLDTWMEHQADRYQALHWLTGQRHIAPVERWLLGQLPSALTPPQDIIKQWGRLLAGCWQGAEALLAQQLTRLFWEVGFDARHQPTSAAQLLARLTLCASQRLDIPLAQMLDTYRRALPTLARGQWHEAYACLLQQPQVQAARQGEAAGPGGERFVQDHAGRYLRDPRILAIARHLLLYGRGPSWLKPAGSLDLPRLLHDLFHARPDQLPALLDGIARQPPALFRLQRIVPFTWLIAALGLLAADRQPLLSAAAALHRCLDGLVLPGTSRQQATQALFLWVLQRGLARDWAALEPQALVGGVMLQLLRERALNPLTLHQALAPQLRHLPEPLRQALQLMVPDPARGRDKPAPRPPVPPAIRKPAATAQLPMRVNNAGIVLMQSFVSLLFERLGLSDREGFLSDTAQRHAVHYLQYVATGLSETQEQYLMLNKVLCGLALDAPIEESIEISDAHKTLCESLIHSFIAHWPAAGHSTVEGFRGNWLVREGFLKEDSDGWTLAVERRPYDVLLARSPYSFSVIKYPWMTKAVFVDWPT
ncbi:contractile injection system tape measure protein [Pseudomonas sp. MWU13-2105]|uniref:contractile injection system tape measure protein n=1 Tax=Pseudomonas sp. MWU13-2105 TaxID=2935074 RepID=UPI00200F1E5E|nr:contractile injection system tape measure protein [Pseudomonas sp. MWU13-2105]